MSSFFLLSAFLSAISLSSVAPSSALRPMRPNAMIETIRMFSSRFVSLMFLRMSGSALASGASHE